MLTDAGGGAARRSWPRPGRRAPAATAGCSSRCSAGCAATPSSPVRGWGRSSSPTSRRWSAAPTGQLAADRDAAPVRLSALRARLADVEDKVVDAELTRMADPPGVHLREEANQQTLTDADRAAALRLRRPGPAQPADRGSSTGHCDRGGAAGAHRGPVQLGGHPGRRVEPARPPRVRPARERGRGDHRPAARGRPGAQADRAGPGGRPRRRQDPHAALGPPGGAAHGGHFFLVKFLEGAEFWHSVLHSVVSGFYAGQGDQLGPTLQALCELAGLQPPSSAPASAA